MDSLITRRLREMFNEEGPEPEAALRRLAVCRGGFTIAAAAAILGLEENSTHLERLLATLRTWQFITFQVIEDGVRHERYAIDPLVVAAAGIDPDARQAHYAYYVDLTQRSHEAGNFSLSAIELSNLEAAFDWSLTQDAAAAYHLYMACGDCLIQSGHADQALDWIQRIEVATRNTADPYLRGQVHNTLGVAYQNATSGPRRDNLRRAIAAYFDALDDHDPETVPQAHAVAQHNLGTALADLARIENRAKNLGHAVAAYQIALSYRTPENAPLAYAATQNALGLAYRDLAGIEDRAANLQRAITAYENALRHYLPDSEPLEYAAIQNNLGNAYRDLAGAEDFAENLRRAVTAYHAALRYRTPQAAPLAYAATQNNLGTAYRALAEEEDPVLNLRRAVAAFEDALRYYTPQSTPLDYAAVCNNLGGVYRVLATFEDAGANLARAVAAFEDALRHATPQVAPLDYAKTQANLGLARQDLGDQVGAVACWREAALHFQRMGETDKADLMLEWITAAGPVSE